MATPTEQLQQLYVAYFSRPADVGGLTYWTNALAAGGTIAQVSAAFAVQPEYTSVYGGKTPDAVIDQVYMNLFGRHAEQGGLDYWGGILQAHPELISNIVTAIVAGAKNADGSPNADGVAYNDKVQAAVAFTNELQVVGNEAERVAYAEGSATVLKIAKDFIASVTDDASLATATANLHATAQQMIGGTPVTTALTTGVDNFVGTVANDIVNGTIGTVVVGGALVSSPTLTGLDSIDGAGGLNTLNIVDQAGGTALPGGLNVTNMQTVKAQSVGAATMDFTTGFTGVTTLNVAGSTGNDNIKAGATTNVTVVDTAGTVTLAGGLTQTVTTAGGYAISGGKGAIVVTDTAQAGVASTITGGTTVNLTTTTAGTGTVAIGGAGALAPTGAVTVVENLNGSGALNGGTIKVTGGTSVNLTVNAAQDTVNTTTTVGAVTVTGSTSTTTVAVTETKAVAAAAKVAGIANNSVSVVDANYGTTTKGTITSVTASGYTTLGINDSALATLSLANGSSNVIIDNSDAVTTAVTTLNLTVNGLTGGTLDDADVYKTLNVTTTGANSTLANITEGAVTAMTIAGTKVLTLTSAAGLTNLKTITVSGSAGLTANSGLGGLVTSIDASATSGNNSVTVDPTVATYKGGSGVDVVTINGVPSLSITGGAGAADELVLNVAAATLANPSGNAFIGGFETLGFGTNATGTYNGSGFTTVHFGSATVAGAVNVTGLAAGTNLLVDAAPGQDVTYTLADATGTADSVNVTIGSASVASTALAGKNINLPLIETVKLTALGDGTGTDTVTLVDTSAKALTIAGTSAVTVTLAGATALASVDASTTTKAVDITGVALGTAGATVKAGSGGLTAAAGTGADTFDLTLSAAAVDTIKFADGSAVPVKLDVVKGFTNFATKTVAGDLSDHLVFTAATPVVVADVAVATNVPNPVDTQDVIPVNVNYTTKSGIITFGGSGLSAATLPQLIGAAESIVDNAGIDEVVAFQYNGDTFVVHSNHTHAAADLTAGDHTTLDSVIQLVGVTGITALDATGAAAAAHTLLVA